MIDLAVILFSWTQVWNIYGTDFTINQVISVCSALLTQCCAPVAKSQGCCFASWFLPLVYDFYLAAQASNISLSGVGMFLCFLTIPHMCSTTFPNSSAVHNAAALSYWWIEGKNWDKHLCWDIDFCPFFKTEILFIKVFQVFDLVNSSAICTYS